MKTQASTYVLVNYITFRLPTFTLHSFLFPLFASIRTLEKIVSRTLSSVFYKADAYSLCLYQKENAHVSYLADDMDSGCLCVARSPQIILGHRKSIERFRAKIEVNAFIF